MTSIYYAGFAIALFAALQSLPLTLNNQRKHVYRAYVFLCAFSALFLFSTAQFLTADTLEQAAFLTKWQAFGSIGFITSFAWLMANYTGNQFQPGVRVGLISYTLACFALLFYALSLPYGLFIENLQILGETQVLGADVVRYRFDPRPESILFQLLAIAGLIWGAWCCLLLRRKDNRFAALLFASYLVLLLFTYASQILYSLNITSAVLPGGTSYLWLFIVISLCFGRDHQSLVSELKYNSRELSAEVERRRQAELQAKQQSLTDDLTGLPNRLALSTALNSPRGDEKQHLLLIQVDRFREIKRVFSESNCDNILLQVGERLKQDMPSNQQVARISEYCFAVLSSKDEAYSLDRSIGSGRWNDDCKLTAPYLAGYQYVEITFSAGIVDIQADDNAQTALYKAEHALEKASSQGANAIVYFSEQFAQEIARQQRLEEDLKLALEQDGLALHYQPLIDRHRKIHGAEALLRWQHPELGMIPPGIFIPLAERSGLMTAIGEWVFEEVCRQILAWQKSETPFRGRLSLNVSPWQLQSEEFSDRVLAILARYGVLPQWLTLELTESALVDNFELTRKQLERLRQEGIKIALDDFGTGFSSLAYISHLPLDTLKIDKTFVDDLDSERGRNLLASMVEIGNALQLKVVVEGVETEEQFQTLQALGCKHYQGYLFCRPMPPDELLGWAQSFEQSAPANTQ